MNEFNDFFVEMPTDSELTEDVKGHIPDDIFDEDEMESADSEISEHVQEVSAILGAEAKTEFNRLVESTLRKNPESPIQAVIEVCEDLGIDPAHAKSYLNEVFINLIKEEAFKRNLVRVEGRSKLPGF